MKRYIILLLLLVAALLSCEAYDNMVMYEYVKGLYCKQYVVKSEDAELYLSDGYLYAFEEGTCLDIDETALAMCSNLKMKKDIEDGMWFLYGLTDYTSADFTTGYDNIEEFKQACLDANGGYENLYLELDPTEDEGTYTVSMKVGGPLITVATTLSDIYIDEYRYQYYKVQLNAGTTYRFSCTGDDNLDAELYMPDDIDDVTEVARYNGSASNFDFNYTVPSGKSGIYFLKVISAYSSSRYSLSVVIVP